MSGVGERRFSRDHEWARLDGDRILVGISDYAQDAVGDVVFVDLPAVGVQVKAGEAVAEVESTKTVSSVMSPLAGTVQAINESLGGAPEQINADPYGAGWMFALAVDGSAQRTELAGLMDEATYLAYVDELAT